MTLPIRSLGNTGMQVSVLGLGAQWLGDPAVPESQVANVLAAALDAGITLIDTARSYGESERRLGKLLRPHRQRIVLSTKLGYDIAGVPDWSYAAVQCGVEEALLRLQTEWLDIVHLHSCPLSVLQRGDVIEALEAAKTQGKLRAMAYSGENDALTFAIESGRFDSVQCSLNPIDQRSLNDYFPQIEARQLGLLIKRPLANAVWQYDDEPERADLQIYWRRWQALRSAFTMTGLAPAELALRFAAFTPGVSAVLVGTTRPASLQQNLMVLARGPLPADLLRHLRSAFAAVGADWPGLI